MVTTRAAIPGEARGTAGAADAARMKELRQGVPRAWGRYTDLVVERGEGSWLETVDGERYLDFTSGIAVASTGHAHPRVVEAVRAQAARILHAQQNIVYHRPGLELHDRLPRYFPAADTDAALFLSNSGAEAIEAAVKLAKMATRRPAIVAFRGGFHGRTHAAMALTASGVKYRAHYEPLIGSVHHAPYAYPLRTPGGSGSAEASVAWSLAGLQELFDTLIHPEDVAAILVEPILGEGGYVVPPDTFLPALREVADRYAILLILDEVQTGFARTGRFFAAEWSGVRPDILVMAKGMASGMPLSGIMASRELLDVFEPGSHGGTYGGNAVACAAALATLDVIEDERLVQRAEVLGERLLTGLRDAAAGCSSVAEVRGRGLMVGLEFAEPGTRAPRPDLAKVMLHEALEQHLLLLTCGTWGQVVRVIPPLVATEDEIDQAVDTIGSALAAIDA